MNTTAQTHQQDLERLKLLRYIDDDFMTICLADNYEGIELILRIVLGRILQLKPFGHRNW